MDIPISIDVYSSTKCLRIEWKDGTVDKLPLFGLRKNCPCVVCRGGHENMDTFEMGFFTVDTDQPGIVTVGIRQIRQVGRHAIQIFWADGHSTGMYRFVNLREWGAWIRSNS